NRHQDGDQRHRRQNDDARAKIAESKHGVVSARARWPGFLCYKLTSKSLTPSPTVTFMERSPRSGCHTRSVYVPLGRSGKLYAPDSSGCVTNGESTTST